MKNLLKIVLAFSFLIVLINPSFASAMTLEELQARVTELTKQVQQLQQLRTQLFQNRTILPAPTNSTIQPIKESSAIPTPTIQPVPEKESSAIPTPTIQPVPESASISPISQPVKWCHNFNVNLKYGDVSDEVESLQIALKNQGFEISGDEKISFGESTASAVSGFQEKYKNEILTPLKLKYSTGFVAKATRAKLNKLYGCGITQPPIVCPQIIPPICESGKIVSQGTNSNGCALPPKCIPTTPSITVLSPNGGEVWEKGKNYEIKIICSPEINKLLNIYLYNTQYESYDDKSFYPLVIGTKCGTEETSIKVTIPDSSSLLDGDKYKLRVETIDYLIKGLSDNYFSIVAAGANFPPIISGVSGPTVLKVNETGTWTIKASDPENGQLTYSVVWGDESTNAFPTTSKSLTYSQTTTFTHSYSKAGIYNTTFTVTDDHNLSAKTSISVNVGNITGVDLTIENIITESGLVNKEIPLTFEIVNRGNETLSQQYGGVHWIFNVNSTDTWSSRVINNGCSGAILNPGAGCRVDVRLTFTTPGTKAISIKADDINIIPETNENNNIEIISTTITTPSITVLSPNGGEKWEIGKTYEIKWVNSNLPNGAKVEIGIALHGTNNYSTLFSNIDSNLGKINWTVNSPQGLYSIYVIYPSYSSPIVSDISDAPFSIVAAGN